MYWFFAQATQSWASCENCPPMLFTSWYPSGHPTNVYIPFSTTHCPLVNRTSSPPLQIALGGQLKQEGTPMAAPARGLHQKVLQYKQFNFVLLSLSRFQLAPS
mmetsp:Transcript_4930/g.15410  ORF Transcript_4930/g.15410 Transcript_4930/m.15410 type:complete len:103 (-) Transcript_4930:140-448(-)